jgi:tetratricopeptide (TPR) repeat protein
VRRAAGNPFFVEELARDLRERKPSRRHRPEALPATVEAVIQARLDRLAPRERELCRAAAVVGREFWRAGARAALPDPDAFDDRALDDTLAELERRNLVFALPPSGVDDDRYAFKHDLVRDVAYQQLPPRERRRTHAQVAGWLVERAGGIDAGADPALLAIIAQHRDAADDRAGAMQAYRWAGERSLAMFAYRDAVTLLGRARTLAGKDDVDLLQMLGSALQVADTVAAAEQVYRAALDLAGPDRNRRADLLGRLGQLATQRGAYHEAVATLAAGLREIEVDGELSPAADPAVAAALYGSLGWVLGYVLGDNQRGLGCSERAVALLENQPEQRRQLARALSRLGANYMRAGRWRDQLACNQRNLAIAEELGDLRSQAGAHHNLCLVQTSLGNLDDALAHIRRALSLHIQNGDQGGAAVARGNLGGLHVEQGDIDAGEAEIGEALRLSERAGSRTFWPEAHGYLARARALAGDLAGAEANVRRAVDLATRAGLIDEGIACRLLATILHRRGDDVGAGAAFARAHECLATTDRFEDARTLAAEARMLRRSAEPARAAGAGELRDRAAAVFRELGAARDLALLDDLDEIR